jgi:hypothetical protein
VLQCRRLEAEFVHRGELDRPTAQKVAASARDG